MPLATELKLTVEDYFALPEGGPRCQLIDGELIPMAPAPNRFHQAVLGNLHLLIAQWLKKNPIGELYLAPFDVQLDSLNLFQPDLVFVSRKRSSIFSNTGTQGAPDLVVEILSPSTARLDLGTKRSLYAQHGVDEMWIVDPDGLEVRIYRFAELADRPVAVYYSGDTFQSAHFPGLSLPVDEVFAR